MANTEDSRDTLGESTEDEKPCAEPEPEKHLRFNSVIKRLEQEAHARRKDAHTYLGRGTLFASVAILGLLLVVVGGEDVVRKALDNWWPDNTVVAVQNAFEEATNAYKRYTTRQTNYEQLTREVAALEARDTENKRPIQLEFESEDEVRRKKSEVEQASREFIQIEMGLVEAEESLTESISLRDAMVAQTSILKAEMREDFPVP